ncbi:3-keto-disaccharide hydrolase [Croceitalea rosinachiae]|uniref:DUF1080 domain-containing protein n=1 Tax=Croceitalea rosinachiae TaxID=3075596 RepID=A0ABU3AB69_9FLAO|nr:DUF1080 domain-containing protein [Croceitalea sp. F388]MDT0607420.1 DUF1080 domain-containing protein [Croceitalea sp. F388]
MSKFFIPIIAVGLLVSCNSSKKTDADTISSSKEKEGQSWTYLFDGSSLEGWRGYNSDKLPPGWVIKDSTLTFDTQLGLEQDYTGGEDIIFGAKEFDNFELYLEWKLPKGGNSGIFYHVQEGYDGPPVVSPEYQLIDDENYANIHDLTAYNTSLGYTKKPNELKPLQRTASDYAMHPADSTKKNLYPAGEWNSSKIVFTPDKVEHWLNGKQVLSFIPWSDDWHKKKNSDKWKNSPDYGKFKTGYIGLQDHSSPIWFRNIKIKEL